MALNSASIEKTGAWYGFLNGICLIVFALLLQITNLVEVPVLRFGFILISVFFICKAIVSLKVARNGRLDYFPGIAVGSVTSIVGTLIFMFFTLLNVMFFNSRIIDIMRNEGFMGENITLSSVFFLITTVGFVGGAITAFIAMQYYKRPDHKLSK